MPVISFTDVAIFPTAGLPKKRVNESRFNNNYSFKIMIIQGSYEYTDFVSVSIFFRQFILWSYRDVDCQKIWFFEELVLDGLFSWNNRPYCDLYRCIFQSKRETREKAQEMTIKSIV